MGSKNIEVSMEVSRDTFLEIEMKKFCHHCLRYKRIFEACRKEMPEKGFLFEMQEQFENIAIRES